MSAANPYAPPDAKLADPPPRPGSPVKAVTLGLLVDIGGTTLATLLLAFVYGVVLAASGAGSEEIAAAVDGGLADSWLFYATSGVGLAFSVLGGYVCARIARRAELKLGAVMAGLSAVIGVALGGDHYQLGTLASLTIASIGAVLIGARWGAARNRGTK